MLLIDPHNPRAHALYDKLSCLVDLSNIPVHLVFGGDGWMLQCIRNHGFTTPFFGVNAGTLGFLLNSNANLERIANCLQQRSWQVHTFPLLELHGTSPHGNQIHGYAVNDVYVARLAGVAANLQLDIDGHNIVDKLICDGLIVATSLGSTAYSSSAGGAPAHPLLSGTHVTPICPHTPRLRPFIIPNEANIQIEVLHPDRRPCQVVGDGFSYGEVQSLQIQAATSTVPIAFLSDNNFTERMVRKILRS